MGQMVLSLRHLAGEVGAEGAGITGSPLASLIGSLLGNQSCPASQGSRVPDMCPCQSRYVSATSLHSLRARVYGIRPSTLLVAKQSSIMKTAIH